MVGVERGAEGVKVVVWWSGLLVWFWFMGMVESTSEGVEVNAVYFGAEIAAGT